MSALGAVWPHASTQIGAPSQTAAEYLIEFNRIAINYYFTGTPSLSGTATLSINLINSNDKDPFFIPATQRTDVREDTAIGTRIHQLVAHDPDVLSNDVLTYTVAEPTTVIDKNGHEIRDIEAFKNLFAVDQYGNVTVNGLLSRDLFASIRMTVIVTDTTAETLQQGKGMLVITVVKVNEIAPVSINQPKLIFIFKRDRLSNKLKKSNANTNGSS